MKWVIGLILLMFVSMAGVTVFRESTRDTDWMAPDSKGTKSITISYGKTIHLADHLTEGKWTIFEFTDDRSSECLRIKKQIQGLIRFRRGVYLRRVKVGTLESDVARQFRLEKVPVVWLYEGAELLYRTLWDAKIPHEYHLVRGADHVGVTLPQRLTEAFRFVGRVLSGPTDDPAADAFRESLKEQKQGLSEADHYGLDKVR